MVFKIFIQPGLTGSETNAGLFRGDPGHHRSSSGMIGLATVRPPGKTIVNRHGLCPMWRYGVFPVWSRCVTEESRRSLHSCRSNYGLARYQPVTSGKVTVGPRYGYGASRWTPIQLWKSYLNHDFISAQTGTHRGYIPEQCE